MAHASFPKAVHVPQLALSPIRAPLGTSKSCDAAAVAAHLVGQLVHANHRGVIAIVALLAAFAVRDVYAEEQWSYEMIPFLWAAGIDGHEGIGGNSSAVDASFQDLIDFVNVGASMRVMARRPPVGWFGEASYVELEVDTPTPLGTVRTNATSTIAEGGLSYELNSALALYGGVRYQEADTKLQFPNNRFSDNQGWVDAIVGARWTPVVSDNWVVWARADIGGGSSDLVWLAEAGGGYRWGSRWGAYVAYRVLDTDYHNGGFLYDIRQSGLMLGFGIRF
jgi:hypothetical protein